MWMVYAAGKARWNLCNVSPVLVARFSVDQWCQCDSNIGGKISVSSALAEYPGESGLRIFLVHY